MQRGDEVSNLFDEIGRAELLLEQDSLDSQIQSGALLHAEVASGDDDDRNVSPCRVLLQCGDQLKSVHFRHHQIEKNDIGRFFLESIQCPPAIFGFAQQPLLRSKPAAQALALDGIVLDH